MERGGFGAGGGEVLPEGAIHLFGPLPGVFLEVKSAISRHARVLMPTGGGGNARFSACTLGWSLYFPPPLMNTELCNEAVTLVGNPNILINLVSARVRQLNSGSSRPLIDDPLLGSADMALKELVDKKMEFSILDEEMAAEVKKAKKRRK